MADDLNITPGSGKTIAADDIGSVYYQRVKIGVGADGEAADLDFGQATMANSLPVAIASNQGAVPVSGTVSGAVVALASNDTAFTGIATVTSAGTAVQGSSVANAEGFLFKAHPDNTDTVWLFPSGGSKTAGYPLNSGEAVPLAVTNLNQVWFDADVSGEKICWIKA